MRDYPKPSITTLNNLGIDRIEMKPKEYVKYKIQAQADGTYAILQKDLVSNKVDIHSNHDTLDEAQNELDSIYSKPSQEEAIKMIRDMRNSMDAINNNTK